MPIWHVQCKLTYSKMPQNSTYLLLHGAPYKSTISSWQPPRYCSEFNFLQMETGCQLVPKMLSVTFLSGFCTPPPPPPQLLTFNQKFLFSYTSINLDKKSALRGIEDNSNIFFYFSTKTYVVTLMMGHKICFYEEIWLIIPFHVTPSSLEHCVSLPLLYLRDSRYDRNDTNNSI